MVNEYANTGNNPGHGRHFALGKYLARRGHDVTIIRSNFNHIVGSSDDQQKVDGVRFLTLRTPRYTTMLGRVLHMFVFALAVATVRMDRDERPDVVIGSTPHSFQAAAARVLAARCRAIFVLEVRDIWPMSLIELGVAGKYNPLVLIIGFLERWICSSARHVLSVLPNGGEYLRRANPQLSWTWIPNGIDLETWPWPAVRSTSQPHVVIYTGSLGIPNATDVLVQAAARVRARGFGSDRIVFRFVGSGVQLESVTRLVEQLQLKGVTFDNAVPKSEVPRLMRSATVAWLAVRDCALYEYGISPNKLGDYMASGRPVVLSANTEWDPVCESGCGVLVPSEDPDAIAQAVIAICSLSENMRHEMGLKGRRYVEKNLSAAVLAARLEGVLFTLLDPF